jgi:hypothetical protein
MSSWALKHFERTCRITENSTDSVLTVNTITTGSDIHVAVFFDEEPNLLTSQGTLTIRETSFSEDICNKKEYRNIDASGLLHGEWDLSEQNITFITQNPKRPKEPVTFRGEIIFLNDRMIELKIGTTLIEVFEGTEFRSDLAAEYLLCR